MSTKNITLSLTLCAVLVVTGLFFFFRTRSTPTTGPLGYIGVTINAQHPGVHEAFSQVTRTIRAIISEELERIAPDCPFDISALYRDRKRCHTIVAYLGDQNAERMSVIQHAIIRKHRDEPCKRGSFELSESLAFFGPNADTVVLLLTDRDDCLLNLHTSLESCLTSVGRDYYIPWHTIGAYIPHITLGKLEFDKLRAIARQSGHSENLLVDRIIKRIRDELFAHFRLQHQSRTIECKNFTLFSPKREIVALCSLK